ncbi:ribosomal protein L1p/L10e family-domain-containing protein [Dipodascopsis tothii]|uniref:ribosomal protein L1p/L10e family-domain-containing protein n=1 Tax=Dipodascopsis tothii TaxID=44089 RepID=UPI0034CE3640
MAGSVTEVSAAQTKKAAAALLKHAQSKSEGEPKKRNLLGDDDEQEGAKEGVYLILTTKKFLADRVVMKPKRITIPHPLYSADTTSVCLLTKDPQRLYKNALLGDEAASKDQIARIIGVSKLKTKFKTFEAKRQLRDEYDLFVADERIVTALPAILGKTFIGHKKLPVPISVLGAGAKGSIARTNKANKGKKPEVSAEDAVAAEQAGVSSRRVAAEIERTLNSATVVLSPGVCTSVKIGYTTFSPEQIAANVTAVMGALAGGEKPVVKGGLKGVRSVYIKTADSVSLPIYLADELHDADDVKAEGEEVVKKAKGKDGKAIKKGKTEEAEAKAEPKAKAEKPKAEPKAKASPKKAAKAAETAPEASPEAAPETKPKAAPKAKTAPKAAAKAAPKKAAPKAKAAPKRKRE